MVARSRVAAPLLTPAANACEGRAVVLVEANACGKTNQHANGAAS